MPWKLIVGAGVAAAAISGLEAAHRSPVPAALSLYCVLALLVIAIWSRTVQAVSRTAGAVLIALPLLFTGPALVQDRAYGPYDLLWLVAPFSDYTADFNAPAQPHNRMLIDLFLQMAPWQHQVRESLSHGEWPLWNPTMLSGQVLAANAQTAPYDPVNVAGLLLPHDIATTFAATMTFFLAAFFCAALARELGCSHGASVLAAAGFMCSSAITFNVGWPVGRAWTILPFVLLAVRRIVRDRDLRATVLLTTSLVLLILCGHPETTLHVVATGVAFAAFELLPVWRDAWRPIALATAAGVVALLLTAIFLLPFVTLLDQSWEYGLRSQSQVTREWAAPPDELARAARASFLPYSGGASWHSMSADWEFGTSRAGSVILVLALLAGIALWRRRDVRFLAGAGIFTLLASWKFAPVGHALHALPLFNVAVNWRLGVVTALCLSLLAALAFDERAQLARGRTITLIVGALLACATWWFWSRQLSLGVDVRLLIAAAAAEFAGIVAVIAALSMRAPRIALAILLLAIGVQRVVEDGNIYPSVPRKAFFPTVPLIDAIPRDPLARTAGLDNVLVPNINAFYGLNDPRGYEAMTLELYSRTWPLWCPDAKRTYHEIHDLSRPFLNFLAVRYAIVPRAVGPPAGWRVLKDDRGSRLLENTRALPKVFVPKRIRTIANPDDALEDMKTATDFADIAWIESRTAAENTVANGDARLAVRVSGTSYAIRTESSSGARLVISESAWPGWRASIDGQRVPIQIANRAFLSVAVPAGTHEVRLVYLPQAFVRGRAISVTTLALLALSAIIWRRRRRIAAG